jgi:AcrR family transcriptional regulator
MRADAAKNRRLIIETAETLLDGRGSERISIDDIARAAGVGKGTIYRAFGSRTGVFEALLTSSASRIHLAIQGEKPPLGTEAPPDQRLRAFLQELCALAADNLALLSAHTNACGDARFDDPTYRTWHQHLTHLLGQLRLGDDGAFAAHVLLGSFDSELARTTIDAVGLAGYRAAVDEVAIAVLGPTRGAHPNAPAKSSLSSPLALL